MPAFIDITGAVFGRLTVLGVNSRGTSKPVTWLCRCSCGQQKIASGSLLKAGDVKSCGCLFLETAAAKGRAKATHGMTDSVEYTTWVGMRGRCLNPRNPKFKDYGGRGIQICKEWGSFDRFFSDMGCRPDGMSLDRINVDGDYTPENCRWANQTTQQNNRRDNTRLLVNGESLTIAEASRRAGINADMVQQRLRRGWSAERALAVSVAART